MREAQEENKNLRQQVIDERNDNQTRLQEDERLRKEADAMLAGQIEALRKQVSESNAAADADLLALEAEKKALLESVRRKKEAEAAELTEEQRKISEAPAIAKIAAVDGGKGFVIIDAGSAKGVESGVRFNIRRDKFIVGEIEISKVIDEGKSIAEIDGAKIPQGLSIRLGDDVVSHPIY